MRIAFVGVKRKYQELAPEYRDVFNKFHLELPYYYAAYGGNDVTITTVDYEDRLGSAPKNVGSGFLDCWTEDRFRFIKNQSYDVVIHWRKWFDDLYVPGALNLLNCQDHSFSPEWKRDVSQAMNEGKLRGILCFPGWHKRNIHEETGIPDDHLFDGVTLGVDTDIYKPALVKDPYQMLWASDPGRGLNDAIMLAINLYQCDRRFILNVCYPDYARNVQAVSHPAIRYHRNIENGPKLWELFNSSGILPYTSCFKEPSSRAHRQAQAAGCLVMYPPSMGTPSELIENGVTGIVDHQSKWRDMIVRLVESGEWKKIGQQARDMAVSENWSVQAQRFNRLVERLLQERNV